MSSYVRESFLNRQLSGVMNASLNGIPMRLNPTEVDISYTVKTSETPTLGGMVVQVFGIEMSDLVVTGTFGAGGYKEQLDFLQRMLNIAGYQANQNFNSAGGPINFIYPNRGYNFQVYLKDYDSASGMAIDYENTNIAPDWRLTLFVDTDNLGGGLARVAADAYIERLSRGLGYKLSPFNGNVSANDVAAFIASQGYANDPQGYLKMAFGSPRQQTTTQTTAASGTSSDGSGTATGGTGAGRYSGASWMPITTNIGGTMSAHKGLVLHVQVGDGSLYGWFGSAASKVSAHFWVAKSGHVEQYVDGNTLAQHAAGANDSYNGVETEGVPTDPLTPQQITALAGIYKWGMQSYGWPKQLCDTVGGAGFAWHGLGGEGWGGHIYCPGDLRKAQRADILKLV
jgi:hypothetical protein